MEQPSSLVTRAEVVELRAACERESVVTTRALDVELARTTLLDRLCLAILFGQGRTASTRAWRTRSPT
ncbi:hypothetical protein ACRAKI_15525 [Saccharothrix isguenensis]